MIGSLVVLGGFAFFTLIWWHHFRNITKKKRDIEDNGLKTYPLDRDINHILLTRAHSIGAGKGIWVLTIAYVCFLTVIIAGSLALVNYSESDGISVYLRLAVAPPSIFAVWFCAHHYTKERKLEEEYTFRAHSWLILNQAKNLYADLPENVKTSLGMNDGYGQIITKSLDDLLTSPVDRVYGRFGRSIIREQSAIAKVISDAAKLVHEAVAKIIPK